MDISKILSSTPSLTMGSSNNNNSNNNRTTPGTSYNTVAASTSMALSNTQVGSSSSTFGLGRSQEVESSRSSLLPHNSGSSRYQAPGHSVFLPSVATAANDPNVEDEASSAPQLQEEAEQVENINTRGRLNVADILNHAEPLPLPAAGRHFPLPVQEGAVQVPPAHVQRLATNSFFFNPPSQTYVSPYGPGPIPRRSETTPPRPQTHTPANPAPLLHGFLNPSNVERRAFLGMNMLNSPVSPAQTEAQYQPRPQIAVEIAERRQRMSIASLLAPNPDGNGSNNRNDHNCTVNRVLLPDIDIGLAVICEGGYLKKDRVASFLEGSLFAPRLAPKKALPPRKYSKPDGMGVYVRVPGKGLAGAGGKRRFESDEDKRRQGLVFDYCGGVWMKRLLKINGDVKRRRLGNESDSEDTDVSSDSDSDDGDDGKANRDQVEDEDEDEDEDGREDEDGDVWGQDERPTQLMLLDDQCQQLVEEIAELSWEEERRRRVVVLEMRREQEQLGPERFERDMEDSDIARLLLLEFIAEERRRLMGEVIPFP